MPEKFCGKPSTQTLKPDQSQPCAPFFHEHLTRYVKLWDAHAPGVPGTFFPPPRVGDPDMHHGTCEMPWCMPGSVTSGFLVSRCRGKRSQHSRRMRNPQFYASGKKAMSAEERQEFLSGILTWSSCCTDKNRPLPYKLIRIQFNATYMGHQVSVD